MDLDRVVAPMQHSVPCCTRLFWEVSCYGSLTSLPSFRKCMKDFWNMWDVFFTLTWFHNTDLCSCIILFLCLPSSCICYCAFSIFDSLSPLSCSWPLPQLEPSQIRLIVYQDCERRGRNVLFDSNTKKRGTEETSITVSHMTVCLRVCTNRMLVTVWTRLPFSYSIHLLCLRVPTCIGHW